MAIGKGIEVAALAEVESCVILFEERDAEIVIVESIETVVFVG